MTGILIAIPLLLALTALVLGVIRSLVSAWLNYRVRLELLRRIEREPGLIHSPTEVQALYERLSAAMDMPDRQDYAVTGFTLGCLGGACIVAGRLLRMGNLAVGLYWGGMLCVFIGFVLVFVGLLIRFIARGAAPRS